MKLTGYLSNRQRGFKANFAKQVGVSMCFLRNCEMGRTKIPPYLAKKIEVATNGEVSKSEMRPDLWD
ncbi:YdaS family helix-turn-helix protein [Gallibacterium genomosp. 1]|uniref:DNA-binding protein n=1 Tax=Gallibacterium genomosp. 1 TaxID=155515 RepID=A0A0A2XX06_9PAST|nr:YdaS family helix-turn-helix protein [Gallibacterium genomosp. 1]KGQ36956.1 DNA-binding protein [Gallibacterium genomosp. 1]